MLRRIMIMPGRNVKLDDFDLKIDMGWITINVLWLRTGGFDSSTHIEQHCHSSYELHIIPYGLGRVALEGRSYDISENSMYLTGPDVYHEQFTDPDDPMEEYCINFEISGGQGQKKKTGADDMEMISDILLKTRFWFGEDMHGCRILFERIIDEIGNKYIGYCSSVKNCLAQIFINMARSFSDNRISDYHLPVKDTNDRRRIIIDEYFNTCGQRICIGELSKRVGLSTRQLNRIILEYYGVSFGEKLADTRMRKAASLLKNTQFSIKEISERVGIEDAAYFSRVFKKYWGCPPSRFTSRAGHR